MSTIDKMLIKGIRSFSPENKTVIEFYKPLTLIVGANGAGKTTIIECLKHACTGELPPNARSGHSFIHDPKVAGETETKGQIKLRFKTTAGRDVVCIRSFQLTQKAARLEYKALESVLQTIDPRTGEKVCLSYRCADMDREVPLLMGVPKAVLENVIFVHQDEANWPLGEPALLKKKFDDIFSATRYTKALEVIKKLHKEQAQLLKEYKLKLDHLQTLKDAAFQLRSAIETDKKKSAEVNARIADRERKATEKLQRVNEVNSLLQKFRSLDEERKVIEGTRTAVVKQRDQKLRELEEESSDPDEDLLSWQADFEKNLAILRIAVKKCERELNDTKIQAEAEKENYSRECKIQGRLQAEAEAHSADKKERDHRIQVLGNRHNLPTEGSAPFSDETATRFTEAATLRLTELHQTLVQAKADNRATDERLTGQLEQIKGRCLQAEGTIHLKKTQIDVARNKVEELDRRIETSAITERTMQDAEAREEEAQKAAETAAARLRDEDFATQSAQKEQEGLVLKQKIAELQREKDSLNAETAERVQLRLKKEDLGEKERTAQRLIHDQIAKVKKVLKGKVPTVREFKVEISAVASVSRRQIDEAKKNADSETRKVAILEDRLKSVQREVSQQQRAREAKRKFLMERLRGLADLDAFEDDYKSAEDRWQSTQRNHDQAVLWTKFVEPSIQHARLHHECMFCERPFAGSEEDKFVSQKQDYLAQAGERVERLKRALADTETRYKTMKDVEQEYRLFAELNHKTLEEASQKEKAVAAELAVAKSAAQDVLMTVAAMEAENKDCEKLEQTAETVERLLREADVLRGQVEDAEFKLDTLSQGGRTVADVNADLDNLEDKRDLWDRQMKKLTERKERVSNEFHQANNKWRSLREDSIKTRADYAMLENMKRQKQELEAQSSALEADILSLQRNLAPLGREQEQCIQSRDTHREKAQKEEAALDETRRGLQRDVDLLKSISYKVDQYRALKKHEQLADISQRIMNSLAKQREHEQRIAALGSQLEGDLDKIRNQETVKRNIDDNLVYRKLVEEVNKLTSALDDRNHALLGLGEKANLEEEIFRLNQEHAALRDEISRGRGEVGAYDANTSANKKLLRDPKYTDVDAKYKNQLIQLKTTEMANKDLDKYYHALDKALTKFHSMKMEEINKIVKELWQQTYRGQDIDSIEIRSDSEGASGSRSYNYRVVMRNGDAELDMRGRCSAGQKVLASLIIRLALAETFCINCGILALDEPTTNLDGPNAESLAAALLRIMEDRKGQANFQLIVITHDERFAQMIGQRQHAESYYRICKDEHQHSKIELQEIFE